MQAEIPEAMVEVQLDNVMQDFGYRLQMQGMQLDQYAKMQKWYGHGTVPRYVPSAGRPSG